MRNPRLLKLYDEPIGDIFLTYANAPLADNPRYFYDVINKVKEYTTIDVDGIEGVIEHIVELAGITDPHILLENINILLENINKRKLTENFNHFRDKAILEEAAIAIGGKRISCHKLDIKGKRLEAPCELRGEVKNFTPIDLCEESVSRKCYECYQYFFRDALLQIIDGKEYTDMSPSHFQDMVFWSSAIGAIKIEPVICEARTGEKGPPQSLLIRDFSHLVSFGNFPDHCEFTRKVTGQFFNDFIIALAFFSLTEFLCNGDRRKLKKCHYCGKFFIAKDAKRNTRCYSPECNREYEREKKRKQRVDDPVRYI